MDATSSATRTIRSADSATSFATIEPVFNLEMSSFHDSYVGSLQFVARTIRTWILGGGGGGGDGGAGQNHDISSIVILHQSHALRYLALPLLLAASTPEYTCAVVIADHRCAHHPPNALAAHAATIHHPLSADETHATMSAPGMGRSTMGRDIAAMRRSIADMML
jgi:hypothetical protein